MEDQHRSYHSYLGQQKPERAGIRYRLGWGIVLVGLALGGLSRPARATDAIPDWASSDSNVTRVLGSARNSLPPGYLRAEVEKMLKPSGWLANGQRLEVVRSLLVKPWQARPGLSVAAAEVRTFRKLDRGSEDLGSTVHLAVFSGQGSALEVKAAGSMEVGKDTSLEELDLAAYRLAPNTVALGVRTSKEIPCTIDCASGIGHNVYLRLFVVDGRQLRPIWSTLMASSSWTTGPSTTTGRETRSITGGRNRLPSVS